MVACCARSRSFSCLTLWLSFMLPTADVANLRCHTLMLRRLLLQPFHVLADLDEVCLVFGLRECPDVEDDELLSATATVLEIRKEALRLEHLADAAHVLHLCLACHTYAPWLLFPGGVPVPYCTTLSGADCLKFRQYSAQYLGNHPLSHWGRISPSVELYWTGGGSGQFG